MSDQFIPIRQFVPPSAQTGTNLGGNSLPSSPQGGSNLSFHDVLQREQMTAAQLQSFNSPNAKTQQSATIPTQSMPKITSANSTPSQSSGMNAERLKILQNLPDTIPQGRNFEQQVLNNYQKYMKFKAEQEDGSTPRQPTISTQTAEPKTQPQALKIDEMNSAQKANSDPFSNGTFNSVFSKSPQTISQAQNPPSYNFEPVKSTQNLPSHYLERPARTASKKATVNKTTQSDTSKNETETTRKKGFFHAFGHFFKDVASGLSLGFYRPDNEPEPSGFSRILYPFKKLVYDAPVKDLLVGVPTGIAHDAGSAFGNNDEPRENQSIAETPHRPRGSYSKPWLNRTLT